MLPFSWVTAMEHFRAPVAYHSGASPAGIAAGDLNGDGKLDLALKLTGGCF
jgi:hypothetical protein